MRSWQTIAYDLPMSLPLPGSIPDSLTWYRFFGFVYLHLLFTSTSSHSYPLLRCAKFTQLQRILNIKFCLFSYCCVCAHTHAHVDGVPWCACGGQRITLQSSFQTHITSKDSCFKVTHPGAQLHMKSAAKWIFPILGHGVTAQPTLQELSQTS